MLQFQTSGVVSNGKVNILGTFNIRNFQQFSKKSGKTHKRDGKTGIFTQKQYKKNIYFYIIVTQKL